MRLIAFLFLLFISIPVAVQANTDTERYLSHAASLNKIDPYINDGFTFTEEFIDRKLTDRTNRTIGKITGILADQNGNISSVMADMKGLGFGRSTLYLNFRALQIDRNGDSYRLPYSRSELQGMLPNMLSAISTAAGGDGLIRVEELEGATLRSEKGKRLGKVKSVICDRHGRRVLALLISDFPDYPHGDFVLPFDRNLMITQKRSRAEIRLAQKYADALTR